ncbi:MAG: hypothetical protein AAGF47_06150 [Planctomycetota bacterium]
MLERTLLGTRRVLLREQDGWMPIDESSVCPRCGRTVGQGEVSPDDGRCSGCRPESSRWDRLIQLGPYQGDLRQAIVETKYGPWRAQGIAIGKRLGARIAAAIADAGIEPGSAVLVPAPMPAGRRFRRGIDHAHVIARAAGRVADIEVAQLLRKSPGPTQASVPKSARSASIRNRIEAVRRVDAGTRLIVLVDDVLTTGATLDACCKALAGEVGTRRRPPGPGSKLRGVFGSNGGRRVMRPIPVWDERPRIWAAAAAVAFEQGRRAAGPQAGQAVGETGSA